MPCLPLIFWQHRNRGEAERRRADDFGKQDMTDDLTVLLRDKRKFGDKGIAAPQPFHQILFGAVGVFHPGKSSFGKRGTHISPMINSALFSRVRKAFWKDILQMIIRNAT